MWAAGAQALLPPGPLPTSLAGPSPFSVSRCPRKLDTLESSLKPKVPSEQCVTALQFSKFMTYNFF